MDRYTILKTIGEGAFGVVYKAREKESTQQVVAIKQFKCAADDDIAKRELQCCSCLSHPNIIAFRDSFRHDSLLHLVFDFAPKNLLQLLDANRRDGLQRDQARSLVYQLCRAIQCCHDNRIIHRDVKPENILLTRNDTLKLCDFGVATKLQYEGTQALTDYVATRWYRSPEQELRCSDYSFCSDVWSIGCIALELMTGAPVFAGESQIDQIRLIQERLGPLPENLKARFAKVLETSGVMGSGPTVAVEIPEQKSFGNVFNGKLSSSELDFIERILRYESRPTILECLKHPYLSTLYLAEEAEKKEKRKAQKCEEILEESFEDERRPVAACDAAAELEGSCEEILEESIEEHVYQPKKPVGKVTDPDDYEDEDFEELSGSFA